MSDVAPHCTTMLYVLDAAMHLALALVAAPLAAAPVGAGGQRHRVVVCPRMGGGGGMQRVQHEKMSQIFKNETKY